MLTENVNPEFFYEYSGSLTTPPCTEGITWNVMAKAVPICQSAYNAIVKANMKATTVPGRGNNRRVQKDYLTVASDVCKKEKNVDGKMVCMKDGSMVMKEEPRKIFFSSPPGGSFSGAFSTTISMVAAGVAAAACLF